MEPANVTQMTLFAYNQEERNAWTPALAGRPSPLPYWSELAAVTRVLTRPLGFKSGGQVGWAAGHPLGRELSVPTGIPGN